MRKQQQWQRSPFLQRLLQPQMPAKYSRASIPPRRSRLYFQASHSNHGVRALFCIYEKKFLQLSSVVMIATPGAHIAESCEDRPLSACVRYAPLWKFSLHKGLTA